MKSDALLPTPDEQVVVPKGKLRGRLFALLQIIFTVALTYIAFRSIDPKDAWLVVQQMSLSALAICLVLLVLQFLVLAWRWALLLREFWKGAEFSLLLQGVLAERLVNQFLPTTVGGDAARVLALVRNGIRPGPAFQSVLFDRGIGLLGIAFLAGVAAPLMLFYHVSVVTIALPVALAIGSALAILVAALIPQSFVERIKGIVKSPRINWLIQTGHDMLQQKHLYVALCIASPLVHLLSCLVFVVIGVSISGYDTFVIYAICAPAILLATALPITLAGWGLRESTAVMLLTQFQISAVDALACSVLYGLIQISTGLIAGVGILVLQYFRSSKERAAQTGSTL